MGKKYFWLKLKDDFFTSKEIKKLRKIAGGDTYTIIYLKMMLLSLKKEGRLYFEGIEDTFIDEVALEIDEETENVKVTIMFLNKCGLIEELNENEFMLIQAANNIGSETQGAERVRRFREGQKALQCNTTVTKCNTEIEKDKEIEKSKRKNKKDIDTLIDGYTDLEELKKTLKDFVLMRKEIKKPLTIRGMELILKTLDKKGSSDYHKIQLLEQSIMNCWQGIFDLKQDFKNSKESNNIFLNMAGEESPF